MRILDGFSAVTASKIRMHHAPGDRSRPDDADLDDEVVPVARPQTGQHGHLRTALDLEDADGVGLADHLERRLVVPRQGRHRQAPSPVLVDQTKGAIDDVQRSQTEQIDLEQTEIFEVVLVPLDHRAAGHRGVLDGHEVVHRLVAEQEAARVDRQVAREVLDLERQAHEMLVRAAARVQADTCGGARSEVLVMRQQTRDTIERRLRQAEGLAHLAHGRAGAVADEVGHHGRIIASIAVVNELDDFLATLVLDVEVDVGRLAALPGQEALEEKIHPHRVHGRDAEHETHGRVCSRAASLTQDPVVPAELHDLTHGQEVAVVVELANELELAFDLLAHLVRHAITVTLPRTGLRERAQAIGCRRTIRQALRGIAIADLRQRERASRRNLVTERDPTGIVRKQKLEGLWRAQRMLGVRANQSPRRGQGDAVTNAREHVLKITPGRRVVEDLVAGGHRHVRTRRLLAKLCFESGIGSHEVA